jgi:hypothetical protein
LVQRSTESSSAPSCPIKKKGKGPKMLRTRAAQADGKLSPNKRKSPVANLD